MNGRGVSTWYPGKASDLATKKNFLWIRNHSTGGAAVCGLFLVYILLITCKIVSLALFYFPRDV